MCVFRQALTSHRDARKCVNKQFCGRKCNCRCQARICSDATYLVTLAPDKRSGSLPELHTTTMASKSGDADEKLEDYSKLVHQTHRETFQS